jgi:hypothetical protein
MIRIAITQAAYDAVADTLPFGSVGYEAKRSADNQIFIWLEKGALSRLDALRQRGLFRGHPTDRSDQGVMARQAAKSALRRRTPGRREPRQRPSR